MKSTDVPVRAKDAGIAMLKMRGMNNVQIAEEVSLSRKTVGKILDKPAIRQMMMDALAEHEFTLSKLAKKNVDMLSAKKEVQVGKKLIETDDNVAQVTAMKELNSIYGVHAPKQLDVRASAAEASLEDLTVQADAALEELGMATEQPTSSGGNDSTEQAGILQV
jgi:predicted transcriptional regulator